MANSWESAPVVGEPDANPKKKDKAATPQGWQAINAASVAEQPNRDSDRLAILQDEYKNETVPANRAALEREINRMGVSAQKQQKPSWMDAPEVADEKPEVKQAPKKESSLLSDVKQGAGNLVAGAVRGAGSIGATLLAPIDMAKDAIAGKGLSLESNRQRRADMDAGLQSMGADPDSMLYKGGKLAGEIAGTAGAGGVLANGVRAVAPSATGLANAVASGGFATGNSLARTASLGAKAADIGTRVAGGAVTGGVSASMVNPGDAATGAVVGGGLPVLAKTAGATGKYVSNALKSLAQPFTKNGQEEIAAKIINKFADGGPTAINAAEIVPGSIPTLAEATGNAGLATLQRGARDLRPNAFVERESLNSAARNALFDDVAGDAAKLDFYRASRATAADELYGKGLDQVNQQPLTPYLKGQITQLLKRPSIDEASRVAQKLAMERGEKPAAEGSLRALQDVKTALGDKIAEATQKGKGGQVKALKATEGKLVDVMEKLSPDLAEARMTYAEMSRPINAMESLQGLRLTDAQGNITLAKVKNAIEGLEKLRSAPGANTAKSITDEQLGALRALHADLLRQSNLGAGKSVGSNTFQNIATDNIISTLLPGRLGGFVTDKAGGLLGQVGKLAYSGPNEAIRNRLADAMLTPRLAETAFRPPQQQLSGLRAGLNSLADYASPAIYRAAPVISAQ